jgi:hypothetical protein
MSSHQQRPAAIKRIQHRPRHAVTRPHHHGPNHTRTLGEPSTCHSRGDHVLSPPTLPWNGRKMGAYRFEMRLWGAFDLEDCI